MENITESEHEESSTDDLQRKIAALHTCNFIHTVKGFDIVNKAAIDAFLELYCFFQDQAEVGNLISGSSAVSKTSLKIWKFMINVFLKPLALLY